MNWWLVISKYNLEFKNKVLTIYKFMLSLQVMQEDRT